MNIPNESNNEILLNTLSLLYVEDDPDAMQELSRFLKKRVSALTTASNGKEGLALCRTRSFDVILTDLRMPEMDGLEFVHHLRDTGIQTPVIITSAFSDTETILKAVDLGIVKYCVKPIDTDPLLCSLIQLASEQLSRSGELILPHSRHMDRQQRLSAEKNLKSDYAHLLKTFTGKGPREIQVTLSAARVELQATDVMTLLEQTILQTPGSDSLITYLRRELYSSCRTQLESMVSQCLDVTSILEEVYISPASGTDRIVFRIR